MTQVDRSQKIAHLAEQILTHKKAYYAGKPKISDAAYDALEDELRRLMPEHPALATVGHEVKSGQKLTHDIPMLSLEKTYALNDLLKWSEGKPVIGTPKIDGNSVSLVYEDGRLVLGKTRGNGRVGEDVTEKILWVPDIPRTLKMKGRVDVRGELYCTESNFAHLTDAMLALNLDRPTNPRNIVAGILGRKTQIELARFFNFFAFEVLVLNETKQPFRSEEEKLRVLGSNGFTLPDHELLSSRSAIERFLEHVRQLMEDSEFGLDGAVFTYNDLKLHEDLGVTAHHPRYKLSFKWQGETAESIIREITWSPSRFGVITPVAVIDPVFLSGAQITNITLHNAASVKAFNLKPGDKIELVRSGEVIPKFLCVKEAARGEYTWPKKCPACKSELTFDDVRLRCSNRSSCPAQKIGTILNWIRSVEIDDISEKRLQQMMDQQLVQDIPDLYKIQEADFLTLPATKEKMAKKLFTNIQARKDISLVQFLSGIGIEGTGPSSWEALTEHYPTLEDILKLTPEAIVQIAGFAETSAEQITQGLKEKSQLIKKLLAAGITPRSETKKTNSGNLLGMTFVITGALSQPRDAIEKLIKQAAGRTSGSVSKNTTAVVTNDTETQSSKMQKARELGIPVWSEEKLLEKIAGK